MEEIVIFMINYIISYPVLSYYYTVYGHANEAIVVGFVIAVVSVVF